MPFKEPFILGPFSVGADGRLSLAREDVSPRFSVRWRGRVVQASLSRGDDGAGQMRIHAGLGRILSTAAADSEGRLASITAVRRLPRMVPPHWTVRLSPDHRSRLETVASVELPVTVGGLVTELAAFLLELDPYLDVLDEAHVFPPQSGF